MAVKETKNLKRSSENDAGQESNLFKKKRLEFCVSSFQKRLRKGECYGALEEFVKLCRGARGTDDPAVQFLREGGELADILRILDRRRHNELSEVSIVFSALHVLLLRVLTKVPEHRKSAEEVCHHLLNSRLSEIHSLLNTKSSAQFKKVTLQLLTAVVTLSTVLAKDVLSYVSLSTEVVDNIVSLGRPDDPQSVRICFIQFLMAFLVEGNPGVRRLLLDKRLILTSIIRGLEYDPSHLVIFVITTIRTKVVEVMEITKTQKIHMFNTRVMCDLLNLYKWKGPAAFAQKRKKDANEVFHEVAVNQQQKESVAESVHSLLLALCTSYRYGIVFHDRSLGTKSRLNTLVASVLKELKQPWENNLLTELTVKITCVCPELSPISYSRVAPILEPRASSPWIKAVNFVTQILTSMKLSGLTFLESNAALTSAKALAASRHVIIPVASPGLLHDHPAVRHKTTELLQAMLRAVDVCLTSLPKQQASEFQRHVLKLLPSAEVLESAWRMALKNSIPEKRPPATEVPIPSPAEQMLALVDLMFLYQKYFPLLLDSGDNHGALTTTLARVLDLGGKSNENMLSLQLKVMQLLTLLDTSVLDPGKAGFVAVVNLLLGASCKSDAMSVEAQSTLGALLLKYRVLEPSAADMTGELGIWLQCCQAVQPSKRPFIISFLQKVLIGVATNPVPYIEQALKVQDTILLSADTGQMKQIAQMDQVDQIFQELLGLVNFEKTSSQELTNRQNQIREKDKEEKFYFNDFGNTVELSPLLMYVDSVIEAKEDLDASVVKYLSCVLVHLLHMQADPRPFLSIVGSWTAIPDAVVEYLNSWDTEEPIVLTKPFGSCSPETSLSRVLLAQDKSIPELEDCSNPVSILLLVRLVVFHIVQLAQRQLLTETVTSVSLEVFMALLRALQETVSHSEPSVTEKYCANFSNLILKHPVLLCYFSPLHKKKQFNEKLVTNLLLDFIERTAINQCPVSKDTCVLLKEKFMRNVLYYLQRSKHIPTNTQILLAAAKSSALTGPEMCSLISKLTKKMTMQPWTELLSYLLCNVDCLPPKQVSTLGYNLVEHLQDEGETSSVAWNVADAFQHYLQRFPHCVHHVPSGLFEVLVCKSGLNLASVILHHQQSYVSLLTSLVEQNESILTAPEVLFPLLSQANHHGPLSASLLKLVYSQYQKDIVEAMLPPLSAAICFANYPDITKQLIMECMSSDESCSLSRSLAQNWKSLRLCTSFHLSVIHDLQVQGGWKKLATELVQLLLHQLKQMLEMKELSPLISQLCSLLGEHLVDNRIKWHKQELQPDENWDMLPVLILRTGLSGLDHHLSHCLFSTFARLLWRANNVKMAAQVFEMTISHSRFLDIVLIQEHAGLKLAVLQLLLTCYNLAPHVMRSAQVPIWLGAYGATLSHSDQVVLKILHYLNNHSDVNMSAYRPFLWGDAAINHYSVRTRAGMSLFRVPQATVALELLQLKIVEKTIAKFPVHRKLFLREQESESETDTFISYMENLEPCQPDVYDPAFMIPLFSHIMAPESAVQELKFSRLGGLALTLATLGSQCGFMRTAALSVLSRFHSRLNPRLSSAQIDEQFLESIRAGIRNLKSSEDHVTPKSAPKKKNKLKTDDASTTMNNENLSSEVASTGQEHQAPKVPNLSATFVARASMILTNPLHVLYKSLNRFVLATPALNLETVPALLELMRPDTVDFRAYQLWLLETLQCGMRTEEDVTYARGRYLFKMLFALFSSSLSDVQTRVLILRLLEATLSVRTGSTVLMKSGMLPWLYSTISSIQKEEDGCLIIAFIRVIIAMKESSLVNMVVPFLLKLPPVMDSSDIHSVLHVALNSPKCLTQDHLIVLLRLCQRVLDHKVIEECLAQLGLSKVVLKSELLVEPYEASARSKDSVDVVDRTALCDMLKNVVHRWLTHNSILMESEPENISRTHQDISV